MYQCTPALERPARGVFAILCGQNAAKSGFGAQNRETEMLLPENAQKASFRFGTAWKI
jgi:hypothetical protein